MTAQPEQGSPAARAPRPATQSATRPRRGLRRSEILAAAAALFAARGYHGVSIDDIGAAAGMREGKDSLYRFITAMAGDAPGYEEAVRALFAGDGARFEAESAPWPADVRAHALALLCAALGRTPSALDAVIPAERLADVRRVLETALPGREVEAAERMSLGLSGAGVFKVTLRGQPYLLRLDNPTGPYSDARRQ